MEICSDLPRALITGLGGFTGQYMARELVAAGYSVWGSSYNSDATTGNVYKVDLCNQGEVAHLVTEVQPEVVVHLAGISFVAHEDCNAMYQVNMLGTRNLLEALAKLPIRPKAVLLASSANVYGNSSQEIIDEQVALLPANDYAVSKLAMEYIARLWMDRLPIIITRPFNYTGIGQAPHFLLPKIVEHFRHQKPYIELGNIDVERDFSDVRFVAQTYRHLLEKIPAGQIFNICSGTTWSLRDVIAVMQEIAGYKIDIRINPQFIRMNEVKRLQGNPGKLNAIVGRLPPIPLQETLRWMYAGHIS